MHESNNTKCTTLPCVYVELWHQPFSLSAIALQDLARLGRWMAGKAVGLVLSGGGSRGLAHLGVLHALDDAGVPVDIIGGTSQVSPGAMSSQYIW